MKIRLSEERISMRASAETKKYFLAAAALSGYNSLSSFILSTVHKEAQKIMSETQSRVLSKKDMDLVISLLNNPPEPNENLIALMQKAAVSYKDDLILE